MDHKVFVGCCMVLLNPAGDKILLAKRIKGADSGGWQLPGGTVDYGDGENIRDAILREVREETGFAIEHADFLCMMNTFYYGKERPLHIGFVGQSATEQIPPNPEPHKAEDWRWFALDALPFGDQWFRMSKVAADFYIRSRKDQDLSRFIVDEEYTRPA